MTQRSKVVVAAVALTTSLVLVPSVAEGGTDARPVVNVNKVVEGDVPDGTEFVVNITCDTGSPSDVDFTFGAEGGSDAVQLSDDNQCLVSETATGGADSVTYEATCTGACVADPPTADGVVLHLQQNGAEAIVTVTNTFPEARPDDVAQEPADVVEIAPTFTG